MNNVTKINDHEAKRRRVLKNFLLSALEHPDPNADEIWKGYLREILELSYDNPKADIDMGLDLEGLGLSQDQIQAIEKQTDITLERGFSALEDAHRQTMVRVCNHLMHIAGRLAELEANNGEIPPAG